jgi:hypothetical protein
MAVNAGWPDLLDARRGPLPLFPGHPLPGPTSNGAKVNSTASEVRTSSSSRRWAELDSMLATGEERWTPPSTESRSMASMRLCGGSHYRAINADQDIGTIPKNEEFDQAIARLLAPGDEESTNRWGGWH